MAGQKSDSAWLLPGGSTDCDEARGSEAVANHGPGMVNEFGSPTASKRRKIDIACQSCRERKLRCNGAKPTCHACLNSGVTCIYRDQARRTEFVFKSARIPKARRQAQRRHIEYENQRPQNESMGGIDAEGQVDQSPIDHSSVKSGDYNIPSTENSVRIPFFRYFGPTGIAPGYKKMLFDVQESNQSHLKERSTTAPARPSQTCAQIQFTNDGYTSLFDNDKLTPRSEILYSLLGIFFDRLSCHFPFYSRDPFIANVKARKTSALLLNSMCALAARFSDLEELRDELIYLRGDVFASKAKLMLVPLLNLPSHEVVASILMIAWHELANNHDVGLWMYTGMACRMAVDLGMEKAATTGPDKIGDPDEIRMVSNLFWAINFLDHIVCFATGRLLTIRREQIDVAYPEETPSMGDPGIMPCPFPCTIRIIQIQGLVNEEINLFTNHLVNLAVESKERLVQYSNDLIAYYTSIHPRLTFDVQNFRDHAANAQGGTFLLLHLWFNAVVIAIHRPGLRFGQNGERDNIFLCSESPQISLSSARTISSIINLAEVVDPKSLVASPFIDQAIEMAGLVFSAESNTLSEGGIEFKSASNTLERHSHHSNYQICLRALQALLGYWRGIGWVLITMQQKYGGIKETDPAEGSVDPHSLIVLSDTKMIQKLLGKVKATKDKAHANKGDAAIGIGVTGMTNLPSKDSIIILESSAPDPWTALTTESSATNETAYGSPAIDSGLEPQAFRSQTALIDGSDLSWMSWLDKRFWQDMDFPVDKSASTYDV